ncbi:MAG TPA: hypothetical protein VJW20_15090 [Candidatus Angelobacter sp.]|nr:hypothetical protein [Candidatus Angelobacter sp.]
MKFIKGRDRKFQIGSRNGFHAREKSRNSAQSADLRSSIRKLQRLRGVETFIPAFYSGKEHWKNEKDFTCCDAFSCPFGRSIICPPIGEGLSGPFGLREPLHQYV